MTSRAPEPKRDEPEGGVPALTGRVPVLVGRLNRDTSTIWFLRPVTPPVSGPWDLTVLVRGA